MNLRLLPFFQWILFFLAVGNINSSSLAQFHAPYEIEIKRSDLYPQGPFFCMGAFSDPLGNTFQFDSRGVWQNGSIQIPVMGEFHYARVPAAEWERELLKMKAGGITIVASYIFWIHHEEEEGLYDWSGNRNLRGFVKLCKKLDLPVVLRVGPWCHGEVRNGGIPEWMVHSGIKLRGNDPEYLQKLYTWYTQIFTQIEGLLWKQGGPVIGVQIENEYRGSGVHLMTLKGMLQDIGFDVPLYTRTGWPKLSSPVPYGEILPLYGDYADGFWDRSLQEMPGDYGKSYLFRSFRNSTVIATEQLPPQSDKDHPEDTGYPYFTCELGGGMMTSYHRRIQIAPYDVYAMALVRVGSGSNLPGYYMYHGGTNPEGRLTTLNEQQASDFTYHNDLPVKSYDFQAPLGEFGQMNGHYHLLRRLHLFLQDFGNELALMPPFFPETMPLDTQDTTLLRWAVRSNGNSGYIFVNNYQRLRATSPQTDVQFSLRLSGQEILVPEKPLTVPADASFFLPFNLKLGSSRLIYSTVQPVTKLSNKGEVVYVFAQIPGIPSEFFFDAQELIVEESVVEPIRNQESLVFKEVPPSRDIAIRLKTSDGLTVKILLLDEATSLACWKGQIMRNEYLFLTESGLIMHPDCLEMEEEVHTDCLISIYPEPDSVFYGDFPLSGRSDGIFIQYVIPASTETPLQAKALLQKEIDFPLRQIPVGKAKVAEMPHDSDFQKAAIWEIVLSESPDPRHRILIQFPYQGDVARFYLGNQLVTDNFYNGKVFEVGLHSFYEQIKTDRMYIKILPLQIKAPIYLPETAWPDFRQTDYIVNLSDLRVIEKRLIGLKLTPKLTD